MGTYYSDFDSLPKKARVALSESTWLGLISDRHIRRITRGRDIVARLKAADGTLCTGSNMTTEWPAGVTAAVREILKMRG